MQIWFGAATLYSSSSKRIDFRVVSQMADYFGNASGKDQMAHKKSCFEIHQT